jgi:hypothetical protein
VIRAGEIAEAVDHAIEASERGRRASRDGDRYGGDSVSGSGVA